MRTRFATSSPDWFAFCRRSAGRTSHPTGECGSAVVIFLALLSLMLLLVAANGKTLLLLKQDLRLLEQRQVQRLELSQTNAASAGPLEAKPTPSTP